VKNLRLWLTSGQIRPRRRHPATKPEQFEAHDLELFPHRDLDALMQACLSATVSLARLELSVWYSKTRCVQIDHGTWRLKEVKARRRFKPPEESVGSGVRGPKAPYVRHGNPGARRGVWLNGDDLEQAPWRERRWSPVVLSLVVLPSNSPFAPFERSLG
jgi:hypothetical protein